LAIQELSPVRQSIRAALSIRMKAVCGVQIPLRDKGNFIAEPALLYLPMTALW
jgi:hypothetical protein